LINYNKQEPPMPDRPTEVKLGIFVISFYSINEQTMDYQVSMYLRQAWRDPRLAFTALGNKSVTARLGDRSWDSIWIPDTFLRNEKAASFHTVTVDNRMVQLNVDGDLWYVTKISATLSCPMDLKKFPMDTQTCPMAFESFGYTMDTMYFGQLTAPVDISDDLQMPQFSLVEHKIKDCSMNYTSGAYPCLEIRFVLRRDIGYFLIQVYVPSILIVILSWVSFWINVDASPARVSIGLLTVLTTTTMSSGAKSTLPRVSYIKAIDVWMIVCLVFVFTSLIEYAVVNVLSRRPARPAAAKQPRTGHGGGHRGGDRRSRSSRRDDAAELSAAHQSAIGRNRNVGCFKRTPGAGGSNLTIDFDTVPPPAPTCRSLTPSGGGGGPQFGRHGGGGGRGGGIQSCLELSPAVGGSRSTVGVAAMPAASTAPPAAAAPAASTTPERDGKYHARRVDKLSRKCFPCVFFTFNVIYWIFYTIPYGTSTQTGVGG
jgi:cation transporter family protein